MDVDWWTINLTLIPIRGCFLLSRLANFHSARFLKYAFVDIPYQAPGAPDRQTVNFINDTLKKNKGYSAFGHYVFFDDDDAAVLVNAHVS